LLGCETGDFVEACEVDYKLLENSQLLRDNLVFECGYLGKNAEWVEHSAEPVIQFINLRWVALLYHMSCEDY
jgi:hypothetical protein